MALNDPATPTIVADQAALPDIAHPLKSLFRVTSTLQPSTSLHSALCTQPHFCTIPFDELSKLPLKNREYSALDSVLEEGSPVQHVYVVVSGSIEVFERKADASGVIKKHRVGQLTAPSVFGMDNVLLGRNLKFTLRAGTELQVALVAKADFFNLVHKHRVFAHSVSSPIITQLSVFQNYQTLCRSIFAVSASVAEAGSTEAYLLNFAGIMQSYVNIRNIRHRGQKVEALDPDALKFVLRLLPQNIVETHVLTLCRSLPPFVSKELARQKAILAKAPECSDESPVRGMIRRESSFANLRQSSTQHTDGSVGVGSVGCSSVPKTGELVMISTAHRRRRSIQLSRGHTMTLLREGFTDILDIVTCLCIYQIESKKLRLHLQSLIDPTALEVLQEGTRQLEDTVSRKGRSDILKSSLTALNFDDVQCEKLMDIWPNSALHHLTALLTGREEVQVRLDTSLARRFDTDPYLQWALTVRRHLLAALHHNGAVCSDAIPSDTVIDIVCSNTNSVTNLLSSFARDDHESILTYGKAYKPKMMESSDQWHNKDDFLYYLSSNLHGRDTELTDRKKRTLDSEGFAVINDTDATGLQVDLIDVDALNGEKVDPQLLEAFAKRAAKRSESKKAGIKVRRHFLVNLDFAFGAQADGILRALILTFGKTIRSVNVISKAGGLDGKRGDVVLPSRIIFSKEMLGDDTQDEFRLSGNKDLSADHVRSLLGPSHAVHSGPVVTIPGLVLQNKQVLSYYRHMWSCDAVEMEAAYYARQVEESTLLGLLNPNVETRFGYHIVELPLAAASDAKEARSATVAEVLPGMYALTRAVLEKVIQLPEE